MIKEIMTDSEGNIIDGSLVLNEANTERNDKLSLASTVLFISLAICGAAGFILTDNDKLLWIAAICFLVGIIGRIKDKNRSNNKNAILIRIIIMTLILTYAFVIPPYIDSYAMWKYPFQQFYIGLYNNISEPEWFPNYRSDVESDYHFSYEPKVLQGFGLYSVCFTTSPERANEYAEEYAAKAHYIIPLREYDKYSAYEIIDPVGSDSDNKTTSVLTIYADDEFWGDYYNSGSEAQIYVLDAVLNHNHPHSSAMIIDKENGMIQLTQLGDYYHNIS